MSRRASTVFDGPPLCHSRISTGNATGRSSNGSCTTTAATTKLLPREIFAVFGGAFTDLS